MYAGQEREGIVGRWKSEEEKGHVSPFKLFIN
jgi:hypothetical protein